MSDDTFTDAMKNGHEVNKTTNMPEHECSCGSINDTDD